MRRSRRISTAGPVEGAANIHFAASLPNFLILESIETWSGFHAQILKKPIRWEEGYVIPPTEPGLGIELDEEVALAHPYTGDRLHLEMTNHPRDVICATATSDSAISADIWQQACCATASSSRSMTSTASWRIAT